jgi:hypothetical protein
VKSGDRVTTPDGPGTIRGFDNGSNIHAGKPVHYSWIIVELDDKRGKTRFYRWYTTTQITKGAT